ncbi:MAG: STAS domain-containing protein [bacterium]|nr:STAS domain-containing protein [bacterium]
MNWENLVNLAIKIESGRDRIELYLKGCLETVDVKTFMNTLTEQFRKKPGIIEINCKDLRHIDSSLIGALIWFLNTAGEYGVQLIYSNLDTGIGKLLESAKLNDHFNLR